MAGGGDTLKEKVMRTVLAKLAEMDLNASPPVMASEIHRIIRRESGCIDPYRELKREYNDFALSLYDDLKDIVEKSSNPLDTAVRLAIAGNIIDFGVFSEIGHDRVRESIEQALVAEPGIDNIKELSGVVSEAEKILYLGDNAGEIVFDRILIETIGAEKIVFAVKSGPVINDVTMEDGLQSGMSDYVKMIDNGSDDPGTILEKCSPDFLREYETADLIIAKGQGNYESLSSQERCICFLLMAKCPVIADHIGCQAGDLIIKLKENVKCRI